MDMNVNPLVAMTALLGPKESDKPYTTEDMLIISLICRTDSYKFGHPFAYPENLRGMSAYGEARVPSHVEIVPGGLQILLKKYFTRAITMADVDAAEKFAIAHFGRPLFKRAAWEKVVTEYNGFPPLIIRAVPEGTVIRGGHAIYSVTCLDPDLAWLASGIETILLRGVWYPTTIATFDRDVKRDIKRFFEISGSDMGLLPFALHDFGGRGVTCAEQAEIGGAAHLFNFMGSDTVEGILAANFYYDDPMSAFSVAATEHSIECSFGLDVEGERQYLIHVLTKLAAPGTIVSIVIKKLTEKTAPAKHSSAVYHSFDNCDQWVGADVECGFDGEPASHTDHPYGSTTAREHHGAYLDLESCVLQHDIDVYDDEGDNGKDVYRCAEALCNDPEIKALIVAHAATGGKVVFRPDSGDMLETVPRILRMQEAAFGYVTNAKNFRKINCVGVIQGDGIDRQGIAIKTLYGNILAMGFSADNVIFGSGGGLLQGVTRDSLKFAQKASAILVEHEDGSLTWQGIAKDPITDPGKKSKEGIITLLRSKMTGELMNARLDLGPIDEEFEDVHQLVYHYGTLYNETNLAQVRDRCAI